MPEAEHKLYRIVLPGGGGVVSTSPNGLPGAMGGIPAGRYRIDELTEQPGFRQPAEKAWGWAVKQADGTVDIRSTVDPG